MLVLIFASLIFIVSLIYYRKIISESFLKKVENIMISNFIALLIVGAICEYFKLISASDMIVLFMLFDIYVAMYLLIRMKRFELEFVNRTWRYVFYLILAPLLFVFVFEMIQVAFLYSLKNLLLLSDSSYEYIDYNLWIQYGISCIALTGFNIITIFGATEKRTVMIKTSIYWVIAIAGTICYFLGAFFPEELLKYFKTTNDVIDLNSYKSYLLLLVVPYLIALLWGIAMIESKQSRFLKVNSIKQDDLCENINLINENLKVLNELFLNPLNDSIDFDEEAQGKLHEINKDLKFLIMMKKNGK